MKKRIILICVLVAAVAAGLFWWRSTRSSGEVKIVTAVAVERGTVRKVLEETGIIKAQGQPLTAKGLDISRGGVFLDTSVPLPAGEVLEMELQLSHFPEQGPWVSCQGIIAWLNQRDRMFKPTHPVGFGVKFTGMPAESAGPLVQFLKTVGRDRSGTGGN